MPWAEQLPSGLWRACWRNEVGRKRSESGYRNRATALRHAGEREARNRRGEKTADGRAPTWGEWCPIWLSARRVEPSTADVDRLRIDKYLSPQWATRRINRITRTEVQAWVNGLADDDRAAGTVEKIYRLFSASMTAAVAEDSVPVTVNPCAGVKTPTVAPGHERFLTRAEVDAIAYHLQGCYYAAVKLAAGTGMRWGELAGLHWQRVDLGNGLIDIVETWDPTAGQIKAYPKGHLRRAVPIVGWLAVILADMRDNAGASLGSSCGLEHARGGAKCRSSLVVPARLGGALNGRNFGRRQWHTACLDAGIDPPRLHDLRHSYASWLVQDGVPLQEVQRLLGHASVLTTQRYSQPRHVAARTRARRAQVIRALGLSRGRADVSVGDLNEPLGRGHRRPIPRGFDDLDVGRADAEYLRLTD